MVDWDIGSLGGLSSGAGCEVSLRSCCCCCWGSCEEDGESVAAAGAREKRLIEMPEVEYDEERPARGAVDDLGSSVWIFREARDEIVESTKDSEGEV